MSVMSLDLVFNVALLIFWLRVWSGNSREFYFNPYLARLSNLTDKVFKFIEPVFFQAPVRLVALISLIFLLVFRCLLVKGESWTLGMGVFWITLDDPGWGGLLAFSFLSFAMFVLNVWTFAVVYLPSRTSSAAHTRVAIRAITYPFSAIKVERRPVVLVIAGMAIVFMLSFLTDHFRVAGPGGLEYVGDISEGGVIPHVMRVAVISVSGLLEIIAAIRTLMLVLVIGSIVSMVAGSPNIAYVCNDWIELLLGFFRRYPLRMGMIDLTPLIFFLVLDIVDGVANRIVYQIFVAI